MPKRRLSLLAGLLMVACVGASSAQVSWGADDRSPRRRMQTISTRRYYVHSDLDRADAEFFGRYMDVVYEAYAERFREFPGGSQLLNLYVFADKDDYLKFLEGKKINGEGTAGMFIGPALLTWVEGNRRSTVLQVLRHEGFHQFAEGRLGRSLPPWANEGMAEYFADGIVGPKRVLTGLIPPARYNGMHKGIEQKTYTSLDKLMAMSHAKWTSSVNEMGQGAEPLYSQSWSLVYFLVHGAEGKHRASFIAYLKNMSRGMESEPAFTQAFKPDTPATIEQAWKDYFTNLKPDTLSRAVQELKYLANGLKHLHGRKVKIDSVQKLYQEMEAAGYPLVAMEDSAFSFDKPGPAPGAGKTPTTPGGAGQPGAKPPVTPGTAALPPGKAPAADDKVRLSVSPSPDPRFPPILTVKAPGNVTLKVVWSFESSGTLAEEIICE